MSAAVERTPLYLDSQGQWLFAWLHRSAAAVDHGVVVCPPLGHEQIHAHRALRHLADAVALAGHPVLRVDYHGSGDSSGSDEDPGRVASWLASIAAARAWLQQQLGCTRISLIGVRLGALLAAQSAADQSVDSLVLWAPVIKGRTYAREMKALSLTTAAARRADSSGVEAGGFLLTDETSGDLGRLDLLQLQPRCRRALIAVRDDAPSDTKLLDHFAALGSAAQQIAVPGYADMMAEPHDTRVPAAAIEAIVAWLRDDVEAKRASPRAVVAPTQIDFDFAGQRLRERAVVISKQPHLFGIITEPVTSPSLPLVLMLNAGSAYRAGPNRLYVGLARQLAADGFRCLRMDICGIGDSVCTDAACENDCYPSTAFRDIELALQYLRAQERAERVVLLGLCSGAYDAFQAAAQFADPLLVESILINPLTFFWAEGMKIGESTAERLRPYQDSVTSARQPGKWLKLLSGRSKLGVRGALSVLWQRWQLAREARRRASATAGSAAARPPGHPQQEDLPGDLVRCAAAQRHLACFFSRSDPGHGVLLLYAARKAEELQNAGALSIHFIDDADHTFSQRATRGALTTMLLEHLRRRYVVSPTR